MKQKGLLGEIAQHTQSQTYRHMQDEKSVKENETHSDYLSRFTILEIGNINNPS